MRATCHATTVSTFTEKFELPCRGVLSRLGTQKLKEAVQFGEKVEATCTCIMCIVNYMHMYCMVPYSICACIQATLRFLKKKGVVQKNHVVREPQPLEAGSRVSFLLPHSTQHPTCTFTVWYVKWKIIHNVHVLQYILQWELQPGV